jgi:exodeoxyribonuclease VII large subunit
LRDVLTTLARRMPSIPVVIYPAPVQGEGAGARLAQAVRTAAQRNEVDVLIVCRGGGSMEDLWEFNSEELVRAVAQCPIPVVCGVGHETDYTLVDFAADMRAPTPTAAAAMTTPDRAELLEELAAIADSLRLAARRLIENQMQRVDYLGKRLVHPGQRIENRLEQLSHLGARLRNARQSQLRALLLRIDALRSSLLSRRPDIGRWHRHCEDLALRLNYAARRDLEQKQRLLASLNANLAHLNPEAVLSRGYAIVTRQDGLIVRDSAELDVGSSVDLRLGRGRAGARIENKD